MAPEAFELIRRFLWLAGTGSEDACLVVTLMLEDQLNDAGFSIVETTDCFD